MSSVQYRAHFLYENAVKIKKWNRFQSTKGTYPYKDNKGGVSFAKEDGYKYQAGSTHNVAVTVGVIYNLPSNGQSGAIISY